MRLPLIIGIAVLLAVGVLAGVVALGSVADADDPAVEPITVDAPAVPPGPAPPAPEPAPRDEDGVVAPPPPVDDDDDDDDIDDLDDDESGDDDDRPGVHDDD